MAITDTGYRRRTIDEILDAKILKSQELFGENINTEQTANYGKYIRVNAYDQYIVEELAEKIYYSINPQTATGQSLDRLGWVLGLTRTPATRATHRVKVVGSEGAYIEYGFLVATRELNFYNVTPTTIDSTGECYITVECEEVGTIGNVTPSDITIISTPRKDIDTVVGTEVVIYGEERESDYNFFKRFEIAREGKGSCTEASIISAISNIPTVHGVYVKVNESATETVDSIPPKSIACYVDGGAGYKQQIGEAIFSKKPVGVGTYGNVEGDDGELGIPVSYGALENYRVHFSYADNVGVYVKLTLTTNATFETNGNATIKNNIIEFINSLKIGETLITTALFSQIYSVNGVVSALLEVSTNGTSYSTNNITVAPTEKLTLNTLLINGSEV